MRFFSRRTRLACVLLGLVVFVGACGRSTGDAPTVERRDPVTGRTWRAAAVLDEAPAAGATARVVAGQTVRAGDGTEITLAVQVGESAIEEGGAILVVVPSHTWTLPQTDDPAAAGYVEARFPAGVSGNRIEIRPEGSTQTPSRTRVEVYLRVLSGRIAPGETVGFTYRPGAVQAIAQDAPLRVYLDPDADAHFAPVTPEPVIRILAGPPVYALVACPSEVVVGASARCRIAVLDRFGNRARGFSGQLDVSVDGDGMISPPGAIRFGPGSGGAATLTVRADSPGFLRVVARLVLPEGAEATPSAAPIRAVENAPLLMRVWGDPHNHSVLSDAFVTVTPAELFDYARNGALLDFAAVTDHAEPIWGDPLTEAQWDEIRRAVERADDPGRFAAIFGQEWTGTFPWDKQYPRGAGHRHLLYPHTQAPLIRADDPATDTPEELAAAMAATGGVSIPHHMLAHWGATDWNHVDPRFDVVAEVYSTHGGSECVRLRPADRRRRQRRGELAPGGRWRGGIASGSSAAATSTTGTRA